MIPESMMTAASTLDAIIEYGDDMGHVANATPDELRDALVLAAERLRGFQAKPPRAAWLYGARRLVAEVWGLVDDHVLSARSPVGDACLDMRDLIDSRWHPKRDEERARIRNPRENR